MKDTFIALGPALFTFFFGAGELMILFKFKRQQSTTSYVNSLIFFILFILSLFIVIAGFGTEFPMMGIIMYGIPAVIFSFVAAFYKNNMEHRFYQKFRTIVFMVFSCLLLIIAIVGTINSFQDGTIGGLSEAEAIQKAQQKMAELGQEQNNQLFTNAECRVEGKTDEDHAGNKVVVYEIHCSYAPRGYYMLEVAKKDGSIHQAERIQY